MDLSLNLAAAAQDAGLLTTMLGVAAVEFLPRLVAALAVFAIGYVISGWIGGTVKGVLGRTGRLEPTLIPVIAAAIRYALLIFVIVAALGQLGVQTTSLLAALGAAGLAIGLALQGTLQNIAAGIMLLWLRPFRVGEYIETASVAGTVEEVGLFATRLRTFDGVYKFVPNSELWNRILTNFSRNGTRMAVIDFPVPIEHDLSEVRRVLKAAAETHPQVAKAPAVEVVPTTVGEASATVQLRAWTTTADFWHTRWDLTEAGKRALAAAGFATSSPRVVRLTGEVTQGPPARAA